jgi:hypothetical protein
MAVCLDSVVFVVRDEMDQPKLWARNCELRNHGQLM